MTGHRRRFSPQFKAEAVQMVISTGGPIAEVARDLGIHDGTVGNWVNAWRRKTRNLTGPFPRWSVPAPASMPGATGPRRPPRPSGVSWRCWSRRRSGQGAALTGAGGGGAAEPGRAPVQRRVGRGPDARAGPACLPAARL
jgi:hypothetical protein